MIKATLSLGVLGLLSMAGTASAASAASPDDGNLLDLAKPVFEAVMHGQGWLGAALALMLIVAAVRRYLPKWFPSRFGWLTSGAGTTASTFLFSFGGALSTAFAAGAGPSFALFRMASLVAMTAAGGYEALKYFVAPLLRKLRDKLPAWMRPGLDLVLWMFERPDPVAKAEAAGDAAVKANPPAGVIAITGKPVDWPPVRDKR